MLETDELTQTRGPSGLLLGVLVFIILAILTAAEFIFALFLNVWPLLALMALLKAGLVMNYYMHIARLFQPEKDEDRESFSYKLTTNRLGLWFFMLSDAFIFGGLLISRFNLLGLTRPETNQFLGVAVTSVLLISSFFANRAEVSMEHGDRKQAMLSLAVTIFLGVTFLAGVVGVEWRIAPFGPADGAQGAIFYTYDRFPCLPRPDRGHFSVDRIAQPGPQALFRRKALGSRGLGGLLALHRCGLDPLLSGFVSDRHTAPLRAPKRRHGQIAALVGKSVSLWKKDFFGLGQVSWCWSCWRQLRRSFTRTRARLLMVRSSTRPAPASDFSLTRRAVLSACRIFAVNMSCSILDILTVTNECPVTMAVLAKARSLLGAQAGQVQVILRFH